MAQGVSSESHENSPVRVSEHHRFVVRTAIHAAMHLLASRSTGVMTVCVMHVAARRLHVVFVLSVL